MRLGIEDDDTLKYRDCSNALNRGNGGELVCKRYCKSNWMLEITQPCYEHKIMCTDNLYIVRLPIERMLIGSG